LGGTGCEISGFGTAGLKFFASASRKIFAQFDRQVVEELIEKQEFVGAYYEADEHE
jgi:hypothetical protein